MKSCITCVLIGCLLLGALCSTANGASGNSRYLFIDSLLNVLKTIEDIPSNKKKSGDDTVKIDLNNQISRVYVEIGDYSLALKHAEQALNEALKVGYSNGLAMAYNNLGCVNTNQSKNTEGLAFVIKSLKISEKNGLKKVASDSYTIMGTIYWKQANYNLAANSYSKALELGRQTSDKSMVAACYINLGNVYIDKKEYQKALQNFREAITIYEEIYAVTGKRRYKKGIAAAYNNIGQVNYEMGDYENALKNLQKSFVLKQEIGDKLPLASSYNNMGKVYLKQGKAEQAYKYFKLGMEAYKELGARFGIQESYDLLSQYYEEINDFKTSLEYHKLYTEIKDSILNEQASIQITEMSVKYDSEKKEKDIELLTKDKALQHAEITRQKLIRNGFIAGLGIALLLAFFIFNRFQITRKQKKIIEYQNSQIVESINYSKKIQDSLLPSVVTMQKALPNLFVFYEPKHIVSGDFYFFKEFENYILLACVDCTGHGVPGGFMSTLGSLLLDKIANDESQKPSEILTKLNNEIIRILHQQSGGELQDGMDLSVCLIDRNNGKIEFCGARNGIIIVTNGEAKRYKANPLPVGGNYMKKGVPIERNFQTQSISLNTTDWVYMYTDGFIEQVGGAEGVPMNYEQFEKQLVNLANKELTEKKISTLYSELDNWRGANERTDDVLIIGFQVS